MDADAPGGGGEGGAGEEGGRPQLPGVGHFERRGLTQWELVRVHGYLQPGRPAERLFRVKEAWMTRGDIATLAPLSWLNDEVINGFVELLRDYARQAEGAGEPLPKVHICNTLFYTKLAESPKYEYSNVRRWTLGRSAVDLFSRDLVIVPINQGNSHWTLGLINLRQKRFEFIDSMHGSDGGRLAVLRRFLEDEHKDKKCAPLDLSDWQDVIYTIADTPHQTNGFDCGMFMSRAAEHLVRGVMVDFTQDDMPDFRRRMILELAQSRLAH